MEHQNIFIPPLHRVDILQGDRLYVPAGRGAVAFVDLRDVGKVAAVPLTDLSAQAGKIYILTRPESYTFYEVARVLSNNTGRKIKYMTATIPG